MYDAGVFEKLERANAQIDIWIDEEEYEEVIDSCEIDKGLKANEKDGKTLYKVLEMAFSHDSCTANKDDEWLSLLNHSSCPVSAICNISPEGDRIELNSPCFDTWSRFFWAKLIRARIQQKGTDCYYRRLDQVVAYLERHCPPILSVKQTDNDEYQSTLLSNLVAVIYLLEMAASGEGVDQRSFADRARRIIKDKIKDKPICDFYDLLARYNIGLGYFHEHGFRNAVLEFNWIIRELGNIWDKDGNFNVCSGISGSFADKRFGRKLLYQPAVHYRAEIQLKLQLAYHAFVTLYKLFTAPFDSDYKEVKKYLIHAESYQQMNKQDEAWKAIKKACDLSLKVDLGDRSQVTIPQALDGEKFENIKVQIQSLLAASYLSYLKEQEKRKDEICKADLSAYLNDLNRFFDEYKQSTKHKKLERAGYLQQLAEYLAWLAKKNKEAIEKENEKRIGKEAVFKEAAKSIYKFNEKDLRKSEFEDTKYPCPCEEKGIDLRRISQELYDAFSKNMRAFFREAKEKFVLQDKKSFLYRLKDLEEKARNNLIWRIRDLNIDDMERPPREWWCLERLPNRNNAFSGLLKCVNSSPNGNNDHLLARDYEKIMDHWDDHFLEHMKDPSFHSPRCRAFHFLGLQRWNSTSPAQGRSLGGGYLIYHTDEDGRVDLGVAVDPGFDFVRNLFHIGYSLSDIDVVLVSHSHVDHVRDFESMIGLLLELHKRTNKKIKRKLHTIMTLGVYRRLEYLIESPGLREFVEPYIVDIEKEIDQEFLYNCKFEFVPDQSEAQNDGVFRPRFMPVLPDKRPNGELHLEITPTKAYHNDYSEYSDSFGFVIKIEDPKSDPTIKYTLGYTGDTSWNGDIMKQYRDKSCDALLVHLGSLIDRKKPKRKKFQHYKSRSECFELIKEKNHPYLMGMLHFLTEIAGVKRDGKKKPLVLMGEFGEEMRGKIRLDFVGRLKEAYGLTLDVLPVDVGVDVLLALDSSNYNDNSVSNWTNDKPQVWCVQCKHFVPLDEANFIHYGHDEALFCVCKTCKKATPDNVLQERLHALYEVGRRLQTH